MELKRFVPFGVKPHYVQMGARHMEAFEHGLAVTVDVVVFLEKTTSTRQRAANRNFVGIDASTFVVRCKYTVLHYGSVIEENETKFYTETCFSDRSIPKRGRLVLAPRTLGGAVITVFVAGKTAYPGKKIFGVTESRWKSYLKSKRVVRKPGRRQLFFPEHLVFSIGQAA